MDLFLVFLFVTISAAGIWQIQVSRKTQKDLKYTKEQLAAREKKLQTILDNAPIVFSAMDRNGILTMSQGKGLEKLGRKSNESVGMSIYDIHAKSSLILSHLETALAGEQVITSFTLRDITFDLFLVPERDHAGNVTGVAMLSVDISDRKKIEEENALLAIREQTAIETSKLKSEFVATMSHEIRTPINGVLGMSSLLLDTPLTPEQKEFTEAIKTSGDGLLRIVNDILDFSKIEAGKLDLEEIRFNLPEIVRHAVKNLNFTAVNKNISLKYEFTPGTQPWVLGDPSRLRQVLLNLIGNAIKFTESGEVIVRMKTESQTTTTSTILIEIQDTGIGISPESISKMFVPFSQAEASMTRRFGGTGLGLSISKQLVEKMGGSIGVLSQPGEGSTFWFKLNFKNAQAPEVDLIERQKIISSIITSKNIPRILIAEDNEINQLIAVRMVEKIGCTAETVNNGLEAVAAVKNNQYDLILMDCQMPEMDGLEATRRIRAANSELNLDIPIIAMTANAMRGDDEKCIAAGMNGYISKPVSPDKLASEISKWLEIVHKRKMANKDAA